MTLKFIWPPKFLDQAPCVACGKPTSKWFRFAVVYGGPLHAHCIFKEAP